MHKSSRNNSNAARSKNRQRFFRTLLGISVVALLLRLVISWELGTLNYGLNSVFAPSPLSDLATYIKLAKDMANFRYSGVFYYQPFYYAVFLPAIYIVTNGSVWAVIIIQSLLGAATALLAGLASGRLFGKVAGYVAATLVAISTPLLLYTPFHQNETLQTFNLFLLFYLTLLACQHWTLRRWSLVGLIAGIAILTRGNAWFFVPGIVVLLFLSGVRKHLSITRHLGALVLFFLFALAIQLPFALHNTRILGKLTGPSTAADAVLALGNSVEAPAGGRNPGLPAGPMEYPEAYARMMQRASEGVSVAFQMLEWMRTEPASFLELQFRKLLLFWDYREIPNNVSLYGEGSFSKVLKLLLPGRSAVLISLGVAGLLVYLGKLFRKRQSGLILLYYCIVAFWGATAVFYILSRFRAPVIPLLAVVGGGYIAWMCKGWKRNPQTRQRRLLFGGAALVFGFWLTSSSYDFYRDNLEATIMRMVRPHGTLVSGCGKLDERFDYGPFTFGGWSENNLESSMVISKEFATTPDTESGEVEWSILTISPGNLIVKVNNDKAQTLEVSKAGLNKLIIPVKPQKEISIEVLRINGEHQLLYDRQRNYNRSALNATPLKGEWIMRLRTPPVSNSSAISRSTNTL